jgi:hypothetical protein
VGDDTIEEIVLVLVLPPRFVLILKFLVIYEIFSKLLLILRTALVADSVLTFSSVLLDEGPRKS